MMIDYVIETLQKKKKIEGNKWLKCRSGQLQAVISLQYKSHSR